MATKSLSIRIDEEMLDKLHNVADYEACSANGQIIVLIRECIEKNEERHGGIKLNKRITFESLPQSPASICTEFQQLRCLSYWKGLYNR